jgi:hypothetical protein
MCGTISDHFTIQAARITRTAETSTRARCIDVARVCPNVYKNVLFVVPLRMSGGTKVKVLEGMSIGKGYPQVLAVCKHCVDAG